MLSEGALGLGEESAPPPAMRERVLHEVERTQQEVPAAAAPAERRSRNFWWYAATFAASFAIIFGAITLFTRDASPSLGDIQAAADAREVTLEGSSPATARFVYSVEEGAGFFVASGLATVDADQTYELWLISGTAPSPAGLFVPSEGLAMVAVEADLDIAVAIAVTVEPEGGSDAPTGEILLAGSLE